MKKKKRIRLTPKEKRQIRKIALSATGGLSAALAGAGLAAGQTEALILVPVSVQSFRLARKKALSKKQKRKRIKALKQLFLGKKHKTKKIA